MILLLSGPIAVGKSAFAEGMIDNFGFRKISSSGFLKQVLKNDNIPESREALQQLGDRLDVETNFSWLTEDVVKPLLDKDVEHDLWLIDAVRKPQQVASFKSRFQDVFHIHLTAEESILESRFVSRLQAGEGSEGVTTYEHAIKHPNEICARAMAQFADLVVDTGRISAFDAGQIVWEKITKGV